MVEVLKLIDQAAGPCVPSITTFSPGVGALTNVFIGEQKASILVQGDVAVGVACPAPCVPALVDPLTCCSVNVFAGLQSLPVAKVTGILTCGYVAGSIFPSFVNVN